VPSDPITIELHPPEEIRGRVRNAAGESMPALAVRIELPGMRRDYVLANLRPGLGTARSREDGTFSLLVLRQLREYGATLELVAESDSGEQGASCTPRRRPGRSPGRRWKSSSRKGRR
jgi:hypothetical protein